MTDVVMPEDGGGVCPLSFKSVGMQFYFNSAPTTVPEPGAASQTCISKRVCSMGEFLAAEVLSSTTNACFNAAWISRVLHTDTTRRRPASSAARPTQCRACLVVPAGLCNTAANFTFTRGKQSPGSDIEPQQLGKSTAELAALCTADLECVGFTSAGWLKSSIKVPSLWEDLPAPVGPCDGLFVQDDINYESEWSGPVAARLQVSFVAM